VGLALAAWEAMQPPTNEPEALVSQHIEANVKAIEALRLRGEQRESRHQLLIEWVTNSVGRPRTLYLMVGVLALWLPYNCTIAPALHVAAFDPPPFLLLQGLGTLLALLLTTMVLTAQNRARRQSDQRAHLDLQINLMSEQKVAKIVALLEELRRDLPIVKDRVDLVAEAMTKNADPDNIVTALEQLDRGGVAKAVAGPAQPEASPSSGPDTPRATRR
jgi:uncharacterized membrane protein